MWLLRLLRLLAILTPFVPARVGYALCSVAGTLFFLFNFRVRRSVLANLRRVDNAMTWPRRELSAMRVCITVATNYYDLIRLRSLDRESIFEHTTVEGLEHIYDALEHGCGAIIVSGHVGNFSVMARLPAALNLRAALIAEKVDPPALYNYMARLRSAMGIEVIAPNSGALLRIVNLLRSNGLLLLAADRDVTGQGHPIAFFGHETTLPVGPVILAMRTGAPLVPAYTLRTSIHKSHVVIEPAIELQCSGNWDEDVRVNHERLTRRLERMISRDPGQWAVLQRVWPPTTSYGRSEAMGSADDSVSTESDAVSSERETSHAR